MIDNLMKFPFLNSLGLHSTTEAEVGDNDAATAVIPDLSMSHSARADDLSTV